MCVTRGNFDDPPLTICKSNTIKFLITYGASNLVKGGAFPIVCQIIDVL